MGQGTKYQETNKDEEIVQHLGFNKAKKDYQVFSRKLFHSRTGLGIIVSLLLIAVIGLAAALGVRSSISEEVVTSCPYGWMVASCPHGWIGYLGKCYYFSEDEADWLSGLRNCSLMGASLLTFETEQELVFLLRYKGPIYHWIGLRKDQGKQWGWANGRIFNNTLFDIIEGGDCAYLNDVAVMSSWCKTKKNWICSKPDAYMQRRKQAEERET